ncbi:unnamed protein product [Gemmataceae bacterium]|nr:unnamed protein product [Gemmataceae bacterium]VTT97464.1 unnamed protein product [Gemmataceae bacterium]
MSASQDADILRSTDKLLGHLGRGFLTPREVVDKVTDELAYHGRTDLAATVLSRLPTLVMQELRVWVREVLRPEYEYRPFILAEWPSEEDRREYICRMQSDLITLAKRIQMLLV